MNDDELLLDDGTAAGNPNEGSGNEGTNNLEDIIDVNTGTKGGGNDDINGTGNEGQGNEGQGSSPTGVDEGSFAHGLEVGTVLDLGDAKYTIGEDGNLYDEENNVFKTVDQVNDFIEENGIEDNDGDPNLTIDNVIEAIGVDIVDEEGNAITFENTPEGIAEYVRAVNENNIAAIQEATYNELVDNVPGLDRFINYVRANGTYEGFGETTDYNVELVESDEAQLEEVIRESFKVFKKGNPDAYIKYCKDSGSLFDVAKDELNALQEADRDYQAAIAEEAAAKEEAELQELEDYWNEVQHVISDGKIGNYRIPENIIVERQGKKVSVSRDDFFNYVSGVVDDEGRTQYDIDKANKAPEEKLNNELLKAYLEFTGGSYSNLVDMAINEKQVATIRLSNRTAKSKGIKVTKPVARGNNNDIMFS